MKTPVQINFSQGLNTKTDKWQIPIGQFESLENSIFQTGGQLTKRNGYGLLTNSSPPNSYLTTLNGNLTSVGNTVSALSESLDTWITKGTLQPCSLSVLPLIRNNLNQTQSDTVASNNLVLTTWTQTYGTNTGNTTQYLFAIADATTGQNIVEPSSMPVLTGGTISGSSRVFVIGNYFLIISPVTVSSSTYLQYCSIPVANPVTASNAANVSAAQNVTSELYTPILSNPGWDAVVNNTQLVIAYNSTTTAQGIHMALLTQQEVAANTASSTILQYNNAAYIASIVSVCVDLTQNIPIYYISFWNNSTTNGYTCACYTSFGAINQAFTPQESITSTVIANLASAAKNDSCTLFYEVVNAYTYDNTVDSNYVSNVSITGAGTVGATAVSVRSVGLASKAFIVDSTIYFLSAFSSVYQSTYFLINGSTSTSAAPIIVAKLAYQNGGGYVGLGLPSVTISGSTASISYLYKDDVEAINTLNNSQQTTAGGIYSQTGVNQVSITLGTGNISTSEIANNLHISGGYLAHYDGYLPVEHNFFLFPEPIVCAYTEVSTVTPTGTASSGSNTITVSSATGVYPGMTIADTTNSTYIPSGTTILFVSGTTVTMSANATHAISGDTLSIQGNIAAVPTGGSAGLGAYYYQVTYEWTDNQGLPYRSAPSVAVPITTIGSGASGSVAISVPTLRLTAKIANKVKIVIYRWSENTEVYNQVTSITNPVLNDPTIDYVTFVDTLPDADVVGNNIIYTTGGVLPDTNASATNIMTLFNSSLCTVSAENPNVINVGKQVVQDTPVEMSTALTIYVEPNQGVIGSLGPITALFPMDDKLINFFKNGIYYENGQPPPVNGATSVGCSLGNYSQPIYITSSVGCNNQQSIVLIPDGLMFQSDKGIWLLGRDLSTQYIGAPVEEFNNYTVTSAQVIPNSNYVVFTLSGTSTSLMYDYYYKQWGTFTGFQAVSSCIYNGLHTVLDNFGRVLQETPGEYLDATNPVNISFTTGWINLASLQGYQRFYDFYILAQYLSPHYLNCQVAYDYNPSIANEALLSPGLFSSSTPSPYGVPVPFGSSGNKEQWRIHAKQQLCQSFQLTITEVFNSAYGTVPGAGFTMSGITARIQIKAATRPIPGATSSGLS